MKIITVLQHDQSVSTLIELTKKGAFIFIDLSHIMPCCVLDTPSWKEMACDNNVTMGGKEEKGYGDDRNVISDMVAAS